MASGLVQKCACIWTSNVRSHGSFSDQTPASVLQWHQKSYMRAVLRRPTGRNSSTTRFTKAVPWSCLTTHSSRHDSKEESFNNSIQSIFVARDFRTESLPETERVSQKLGVDNAHMNEWIEEVKGYFRNLTLGEISVSPYDTAWVARVPALDGSNGPQFPLSLQWIADHQLPDGDWAGESTVFLGYDRVANTLACIIALQTWGVGADNVERGVKFIRANLQKMEDDNATHMPVAFEIVITTMLDDAKALGLDLPYDAPMLQHLYAEREEKLKKIPMAVMHKFPTTLLHSLEGVHKCVDWTALLKLQSENGSFLFSPASTACALMYTKDAKCFQYLDTLLTKFNHACPNVYPVDLFERLWMVDRLERLGISRYFELEIQDSLNYVFKYWKDYGIGWTGNSPVPDLDDTAMAFRLLRTHGFHVTEDCFRQFYRDGEFFCFVGQSGQDVTVMFNLSRASQTLFPGESLLGKARTFTHSFLKDKHNRHECFDRWILSKDLAGEVEYSLEFPWYASLPRLEHRTYLDQYGTDDIWIAKTLYRMPSVTNEVFLRLAIADFNMCQALHKKELELVSRWNASCNFGDLDFARQNLVECFFTGAATFFEPEMSHARLTWIQQCVLATAVDDYFDHSGVPVGELRAFQQAVRAWDPSLVRTLPDRAKILFNALYTTVNDTAREACIAQGRDVSQHLRYDWDRLVTSNLTEAEWTKSSYTPSFDEYINVAEISIGFEHIVGSTLLFVGHTLDEAVLYSSDYRKLMRLANRICRILNDVRATERETSEGKKSSVHIYVLENQVSEEQAVAYLEELADRMMQQLTFEVLRPSSSLPVACKRVFFEACRLSQCIYKDIDRFSSQMAMSGLVKKVLFEPVPTVNEK